MNKLYLLFAVAALVCGVGYPSSAQLSFNSGVDADAGPNSYYAATQFRNFSNAGGTGEFATGTQNNLTGVDYVTWSQRTYDFAYTYTPTLALTDIPTVGEGEDSSVNAPAAPATELQIIDSNTGIGHLILSLTSINSVADGTETFAPGTTWSAANGATLQAYLDSPTLFNSGFTLNGTITLDTPANSTDYGDNLGSLIELNLTSTPEPSTWALMACGAGLLGSFRMRRIK